MDTTFVEVIVGETEEYCYEIEVGSTIHSYDESIDGKNCEITFDEEEFCFDIEGLSVGRDMVYVEKCKNNQCDSSVIVVDVLAGEKIENTLDVPQYESIFASLGKPLSKGNFTFVTKKEFTSNKVNYKINRKDFNIRFTGKKLGKDTLIVTLVEGTNSRDYFFYINVTKPSKQKGWFSLKDDNFYMNKGSMLRMNVLQNDHIEKQDNFKIQILEYPQYGDLLINDKNEFVYNSEKEFCGGIVNYKYTVETTDGFKKEANVIIDIKCEEVVMFSGLSPNGDGVNDVLIIKNIEQFPENELSIFDKRGNEVFFKENYANDFPCNGKVNSRLVDKGVYSYVLKLNETNAYYSGYIHVVF